jgi:hypothetical protein
MFVRWLAAEVGRLMANPATRDRLRAMSLELHPPSTPEWFAAYIKTGIELGGGPENSGAELE